MAARVPMHALSPEERMILKVLRDQPGVSLWDATKRVPFAIGTFYAYLARLEKAGLAKQRRAGRQVFLYPVAEGVDIPRRAKRVKRLSASARRVALLVLQHPDADLATLREMSGSSLRLLQHHVKNLVDEGFVTAASDTRYRGLRATPKLLAALGHEVGQ